MIKRLCKWLFTIWIIWLWIINFSSATPTLHSVWWVFTSPNNSSYEVWVLNKWTVFTQYLWHWKKVFSPNTSLFFWTKDWFPYIWTNYRYSNWKYREWYLKYYFTCPVITSETSLSNFYSSCTYGWVLIDDSFPTIIWNFLSKINSNDYFLFEEVYKSWYWNTLNLCFSSSEVWSSVCFSSYFCFWSSCFYDLFSWSLELWNVNFSSIPDSIIWDSPWVLWWDNWDEWSIWSSYMCPTVWQLLTTYDSSIYNTWLCYSNSLIMSWWNLITITPKSIFELFNDRNEYLNYVNLYSSYCLSSAQNNSQCVNAFTWKDIEYSYLANAFSKWNVKPSYLYQYCNLSLNYDKNASTCVGSWITLDPSEISENDFINSIIGWDFTKIYQLPNTWDDSVYNVFSWDYSDTDILGWIQWFYNLFTWLFKQQLDWTSVWILPKYIVAFLLVIVLFKFFKRK